MGGRPAELEGTSALACGVFELELEEDVAGSVQPVADGDEELISV